MRTQSSVIGSWAFTRVELVVIISVVVVLAAFIWPAMHNAKTKVHRIRCTSYLKQLGLSFRIFATDNANSFPTHVMTNQSGAPAFLGGGDAYRYFLSMSNELGTPLILRCPADRIRTTAASWSALRSENISYFVSLDAKETEPDMMLCGDSNLTTNDVPVKPGLLLLTPNINLGWGADRHNGAGNTLCGDGSILQSSIARLQEQNRKSAGTNRLLIP
jgi:hypothetical protein